MKHDAVLVELKMAFEAIRRNDETQFNYHQRRRYDGQLPTGGTRWAEPKEIAHEAIKKIDKLLAEPERIYLCELPTCPGHGSKAGVCVP